MFSNTPTTVPVTLSMLSNVPRIGYHHVLVASNDIPVPPRPPNKVRPFESRIPVVATPHRATADTDALGAPLITPVKFLGVPRVPMCPNAPKKAPPSQSRIPVKTKTTVSNVVKNVLQVRVPVTPTKVCVHVESPIASATPARALPYRAPSTWGPRRGSPVSVATVEAKAVISKLDSVLRARAPAPASPVRSVICGPQPGKFKLVRLAKKPSTSNTATPVKDQKLFKSPTLEMDLTQDISRRVLHRASDKVLAHNLPLTTPVSKQAPRPEVPSMPKPARIVDKLTKVKVSQPRDASATLMLDGDVGQAPKTLCRNVQAKTPAVPTKTSNASSRRSPSEDIARLKYTAVSTPSKLVPDRCAMRLTVETQVVVGATPRKVVIKTPAAPMNTAKMSRLRPIEEILRLEYCVVDVPPKSVSNVCAMEPSWIENVIAIEYVIVDSSEVVTPRGERCVEVPQAPRKTLRTRSLRFLKKVSRLDFLQAFQDV